MPRNYVDNAYNRSVGRVGLPVGSAVISSSGGGGSSSYSGGGGGYYSGGGSTSYSSGGGGYSGSSSSTRTYVDNAFNRREGRVGLPVGTAVISRSSGGGGGGSSGYYGGSADATSASSTKTYVDNAYNRQEGRVGLPVGSAVISRSSGGTSRSGGTGGGGSSSFATYVDNAYNRRLGRVGQPRGNYGFSSKSSGTGTPAFSGGKRCYVDNAMNRRLGRVGKQVGTAPFTTTGSSSYRMLQSESRVQSPTFIEIYRPLFRFDPEDPALIDVYDQLEQKKQCCLDDPEKYRHIEAAQGIINRSDAVISKYTSASKMTPPEWLKGGEVIDHDELEIGEKLGSGAFGDVHLAIWKGKHQVVVKKLRVQRVHEKKRVQFQQEVKMISSLLHPAIVKFYGACIQTPNIAIIMEFMAGGSLHDLLHVECRHLTVQQKVTMTEDLLSALDYLHKNNIAHRDIKSMNVLITEDLNHCKLGDFGLALKDDTTASSSVADFAVVGTIRYSSPEMLEGSRLTLSGLKAADIYASSLTINELWAGEEPFGGLNMHQVRKAVIDGERPDCHQFMNGSSENQGQRRVPAELKKIIAEGWVQRSDERPTAKAFLKWFRQIKEDLIEGDDGDGSSSSRSVLLL